MSTPMEKECPWERHWDDSSGSYYYFNSTTEASEWEVPEGWEAHFANIDAKEAAAGAAATLPDPVEAEIGDQAAEHQQDPEVSGQEWGVDADTPAAREPGGQANGDGDYSIQEANNADYANGESMSAAEGPGAREFHDEEGSAAHATVSPENFPTSAPYGGAGDVAAGDEDKGDIVGGTSMEDPAVAEASAPSSCPWIKTEDDSGTVYYYNEITEESVWEEPAEYTQLNSASRDDEEGAREDPGAVAHQEDPMENQDQGTGNRMEDNGEEGDSPHPPTVVTPTPQEHRRQQVRGTAVAARFSSHIQRDSPSPEFYNGGGGIGTGGGVTSPSSGEDFSPGHIWQGSPSTSPPGSFSLGASPSPTLGVASAAGYAVGELSPILENGDGELVDVPGGVNVGGRGTGMVMSTGKENKKEPSQEELNERIKRAERAVIDLERRLEERDAIMEIDFHTRVTEYQSAMSHLKELKGEKHNSKESLNQSVKKLIAGYHGYAQQTSLVNSWLRMVSGGEKDDSEEMMVRELKELIMDNFDAKKADGILDSGRVPPWLSAMQSDDGWRRTLIELAKEHRGSALLRFILKQLSDKGHHREIAAVISETDLFSVFNGVLKDALARIPADDEEQIMDAIEDLKRMCCSTSFMFLYSQQLLIDLEAAAKEDSSLGGGAKAETSDDAEKSTDADEGGGSRRSGSRKRGRGEQGSGQRQKQQRQQQQAAKKTRANSAGIDKVVAESEVVGNAATARKYKRLRQELVKHMCEIGEARGSSVSKHSGYVSSAKARGRPSVAFVREVERALSEGTHAVLHPSGKGIPAVIADAIKSDRAASDAVASLLRQVGSGGGGGASAVAKSAVGGPRRGVPPVGVGSVGTTQRAAVLSEAVETLVSAYGLEAAKSAAVLQGVAEQAPASDVVRPSASLVRHDSVMNILLEALFHPMLRSLSDDVKKGCCAILAYASCVEVQPRSTSGGIAGKGKDTVDPVESAETSQALMRAAHVCFDKRASKPGFLHERLRSLAEHPIVSLGIMTWIRVQVSMDSFCSTPNFLSSSPVFLKLCELTADEHPPQRPEVFEVLKLMLSARMAPDTPMTSRTNLKKQVLLRMAYIMAKGYVIPVLVYIRKMAAGPSLDQSLAAFFIAKVIDITQPKRDTMKYSTAFSNALVALMVTPRVRQALQSSSLPAMDRERVHAYVRFCVKFQAGDFTAESLSTRLSHASRDARLREHVALWRSRQDRRRVERSNRIQAAECVDVAAQMRGLGAIKQLQADMDVSAPALGPRDGMP